MSGAATMPVTKHKKIDMSGWCTSKSMRCSAVTRAVCGTSSVPAATLKPGDVRCRCTFAGRGRGTGAESDTPDMTTQPVPKLEKSGVPSWHVSAGCSTATRPGSGASGKTKLEKSSAPNLGASTGCNTDCGVSSVPVATLDLGDACSQGMFTGRGRVTGAERDAPGVTTPPTGV
jgi:hypothetical protein